MGRKRKRGEGGTWDAAGDLRPFPSSWLDVFLPLEVVCSSEGWGQRDGEWGGWSSLQFLLKIDSMVEWEGPGPGESV